jgi:hypothetical protein
MAFRMSALFCARELRLNNVNPAMKTDVLAKKYQDMIRNADLIER